MLEDLSLVVAGDQSCGAVGPCLHPLLKDASSVCECACSASVLLWACIPSLRLEILLATTLLSFIRVRSWVIICANIVLAWGETSEQGEYVARTHPTHVLEQVGVHEQRFWMRGVGRISMPVSGRIKTILKHSSTAKIARWLAVAQ